MSFQYKIALLLLGVIAIANAQFGHDIHNGHEDHHAPADYSFKYGVKDGHTGDHKDQWETRHGDVVKGEYSVAQPDGTIRTVHYSADPHNGFTAVVKNSGHATHPQHYKKHHEPLIEHHHHHQQPLFVPHHHHHHQASAHQEHNSVHHHQSIVHHPSHHHL